MVTMLAALLLTAATGVDAGTPPRLVVIQEVTAFVDEAGCHLVHPDGGSTPEKSEFCARLTRSAKQQKESPK